MDIYEYWLEHWVEDLQEMLRLFMKENPSVSKQDLKDWHEHIWTTL